VSVGQSFGRGGSAHIAFTLFFVVFWKNWLRQTIPLERSRFALSECFLHFCYGILFQGDISFRKNDIIQSEGGLEDRYMSTPVDPPSWCTYPRISSIKMNPWTLPNRPNFFVRKWPLCDDFSDVGHHMHIFETGSYMNCSSVCPHHNMLTI